MKKTIVNIAPAVAETPRTKRVAAYARVSCGKDTMLHSLAAQIDYYRDYIMMNPECRFAGVYADEAVIIGLKPPSTNGRRFSPISITGHFPI